MIPLDASILEFDYEWKQGSRERAMVIAKEFVNLYRDELTPIYGKYSREELVLEMQRLRAKGAPRYHDMLVTDMWILSEFPLMEITGKAEIVVDIVKVIAQGLERTRVK